MSAPDLSRPLPAVIPDRVGSYALVRRIGSGGMGEVWLGRHVVSGGLGAVKRLAPYGRERSPLAVSFAREGRAVARLAHPHVVPVFEIGDDYMVSAYVDGANLARRLYTPVEPAEALRIARQIADALAHAHDRGVVHRDVKPSNILIDSQGNAYLADFGLVSFVGEDDDPVRAGGTPQFMAPEQRRAGPVGPAVDQYALGRTLLEMLAGRGVPLDPAAALAELPAYLPALLRAIIARATAPLPADRFPSMHAFAAALTAVELDAFAAPRRLAPAVRDPTPFGWLAGAHTTTQVGPDLERADYRLSDLAAAGLLRAEAVAELLRTTGLRDLGFSAWASSARLGSITDPASLARASDVVIFLHGFGGTRQVWRYLARQVCRDNARAVVLTPDLHGFGETEFDGVPPRELAGPVAMARAVDEWRKLLGLVAIPTALVGHSMGGLALLTLDDDRAGPYVSRVAINPVPMGHAPKVRRQFRIMALATATFGRIGFIRRASLRSMVRKNYHDVSAEAVELALDQLLRMPGGVMARIVAGLTDASGKLGRHRRVAIVACLDDPWLDEAALGRMVDDVGIAAPQVYRMANGGHHAYVEMRENPEWTARNMADIVRVIDSMLITAGESSTSGSSSSDATTMMAGISDRTE